MNEKELYIEGVLAWRKEVQLMIKENSLRIQHIQEVRDNLNQQAMWAIKQNETLAKRIKLAEKEIDDMEDEEDKAEKEAGRMIAEEVLQRYPKTRKEILETFGVENLYYLKGSYKLGRLKADLMKGEYKKGWLFIYREEDEIINCIFKVDKRITAFTIQTTEYEEVKE